MGNNFLTEEKDIIKEREVSGTFYKLIRVESYKNCFVIAVCDGRDFYCGSFTCNEEEAVSIFDELADSETAPYSVSDILRDLQINKL